MNSIVDDTDPIDGAHPADGDLHPDVIRVASLLRGAGLVPPAGGEVERVRRYLERVTSFIATSSVPLADERLVSVQADGREVQCKLYRPDVAHSPGLLFYCHGGGFRHGDLPGWDAPLRQLVRESGVAVLSIGYSLAPEHPFPTAFDEVVAVARQVVREGAIAGFTVNRFALGGDSAGANLALGAAVALREDGVDCLAHLLLFYGVYSQDTSSDSWQRLSNAAGHGLSAQSMRLYWDSYLANGEDDWRVQPLYADLRGLPRTRLVVGDRDPLLDENRALHGALERSGVKVELAVWPGLIHGVLRFNELADVVQELIRLEGQALRASFR